MKVKITNKQDFLKLFSTKKSNGSFIPDYKYGFNSVPAQLSGNLENDCFQIKKMDLEQFRNPFIKIKSVPCDGTEKEVTAVPVRYARGQWRVFEVTFFKMDEANIFVPLLSESGGGRIQGIILTDAPVKKVTSAFDKKGTFYKVGEQYAYHFLGYEYGRENDPDFDPIKNTLKKLGYYPAWDFDEIIKNIKI